MTTLGNYIHLTIKPVYQAALADWYAGRPADMKFTLAVISLYQKLLPLSSYVYAKPSHHAPESIAPESNQISIFIPNGGNNSGQWTELARNAEGVFDALEESRLFDPAYLRAARLDYLGQRDFEAGLGAFQGFMSRKVAAGIGRGGRGSGAN